MFTKEINIKQSDIPQIWSVEAGDFANRVKNSLISSLYNFSS
jgi:hypothetical protein